MQGVLSCSHWPNIYYKAGAGRYGFSGHDRLPITVQRVSNYHHTVTFNPAYIQVMQARGENISNTPAVPLNPRLNQCKTRSWLGVIRHSGHVITRTIMTIIVVIIHMYWHNVIGTLTLCCAAHHPTVTIWYGHRWYILRTIYGMVCMYIHLILVATDRVIFSLSTR